jgi:hypothetical protein
MKYVKDLLEPEITTLNEMYRNAPVHRLRQRAHIILMSNRRIAINEIALATDLDRDTISATIVAWETIGIIGLYDAKRSGRPSIYTDDEKVFIQRKIEEEPRQIKAVTAEISTLTGKASSIHTIKRVAKQKGMRWKRLKKR